MKPVLKRRLVIAWLAVLALTGCSGAGAKAAVGGAGHGAGEKTVLRYLGSPGSVGFHELAEDLGYFPTIRLKTVGNAVGGPQSIQLTATGDIAFGSSFNGAIIKAIANGAKVRSVIGSYGSDEQTSMGYYVLEESPIRSARDLIGKTVGMNILGAHAEVVLKHYLRQNGLTEEEIGQVSLVVIPSTETEQALRNKHIDVATMSGIYRDRALDRGGIRELFTDVDLFGPFTAGSYVFSEAFIADRPDTVREFVEGTARAIEWARATPRDEVIARFEAIIRKRNPNETTEVVRYWKSTGIAAKGGYIEESEFQVWLDWLVENGALEEDQVTPDDLYTNEFNPYRDEFR